MFEMKVHSIYTGVYLDRLYFHRYCWYLFVFLIVYETKNGCILNGFYNIKEVFE